MELSQKDKLTESHISDILQIKSQINMWDMVRNQPEGFCHLRKGFGFSILKSEFDSWNSILSPNDNIRVYFAIDSQNELTFYLVDSLTDNLGKDSTYSAYQLGVNTFRKNFFDNRLIPPIPMEIPTINFDGDGTLLNSDEIVRRIFNWQLFGKLWFDIQSTSEFFEKVIVGDGSERFFAGVLKCITIPFKDLQALFSISPSPKSVFAFFALRTDDKAKSQLMKYMLELILTTNFDAPSGAKGIVINHLKDVTMPRPPFSVASGYNLF